MAEESLRRREENDGKIEEIKREKNKGWERREKRREEEEKRRGGQRRVEKSRVE